MVKAALTLIVCFCLSLPAFAQTGQKKNGNQPARPAWAELSPRQQHVLAPLADEWEALDTLRRKKWVTIANRFPKMKPAEQQRLQRRMQEWAKLTPEQRRVAREKYRTLKQLPPTQRQEVSQKWQQYRQTLTPQTDSGQEVAPTAEPSAPEAPTGK